MNKEDIADYNELSQELDEDPDVDKYEKESILASLWSDCEQAKVERKELEHE